MMAEVATEIEPAARDLLQVEGATDQLVALASIAISLRKIAQATEPVEVVRNPPFVAPTRLPVERYNDYMTRLIAMFTAWANGDKL